MLRPITFETFEARRLLSYTFVGSPVEDHIVIDMVGGAYEFTWNGNTSTWPASLIDSIIVDGNGGNDTVHLRAAGVPVTVNGHAGDDTLTVGAVTLDRVTDGVTFNGGADDDDLVLADAASVSTDGYTIGHDAAWRTRSGTGAVSPRVDYTGVQDVTLMASLGRNEIRVEASPAGDGAAATTAPELGAARSAGAAGAPDGGASNTITILAGDGDDDVRLAPSLLNLNAIRSLVDVDGGAGADTVSLFDFNYSGPEDYRIDASNVDWNELGPGNGRLTHTDVSAVSLFAGSGGNVFDVDSSSASTPLTLVGQNNPNRLYLGDGNLSQIAAVNFRGGTGVDEVWLDDHLCSAGPINYSITHDSATWGTLSGLTHQSVDAIRLDAGTRGDTIVIDTSASTTMNETRVFAGAGDDTIHLDGTGVTDAALLDTGPGDEVVTVNRDGTGHAFVTFPSSQLVASLSIGPNGNTFLPDGPELRTLVTRALAIDASGRLDFSDNAVVVDYAGASPIAAIGAMVGSGYNGGLWFGGGGIENAYAAFAGNTAVGYAEASDLFGTFPATFAGVSVDSTAVLLRYTFYGDANLDGRVNLSDFNRVAANFGGTNRRWSQGDFNFDGTVNLTDFNRLAARFGAAAGALTDLIG